MNTKIHFIKASRKCLRFPCETTRTLPSMCIIMHRKLRKLSLGWSGLEVMLAQDLWIHWTWISGRTSLERIFFLISPLLSVDFLHISILCNENILFELQELISLVC